MNSYACVFTQRRDGRFSLRFQTLAVSVTVSHFSCRYHVNATPKRKNFGPFSNFVGTVVLEDSLLQSIDRNYTTNRFQIR